MLLAQPVQTVTTMDTVNARRSLAVGSVSDVHPNIGDFPTAKVSLHTRLCFYRAIESILSILRIIWVSFDTVFHITESSATSILVHIPFFNSWFDKIFFNVSSLFSISFWVILIQYYGSTFQNFIVFSACQCDERGSFTLRCRRSTGQCPCLPHFTGRNCDQCRVGFFDFPECRTCNCFAAGIKLSPEAPTGCHLDNPVSCTYFIVYIHDLNSVASL